MRCLLVLVSRLSESSLKYFRLFLSHYEVLLKKRIIKYTRTQIFFVGLGRSRNEWNESRKRNEWEREKQEKKVRRRVDCGKMFFFPSSRYYERT